MYSPEAMVTAERIWDIHENDLALLLACLARIRDIRHGQTASEREESDMKLAMAMLLTRLGVRGKDERR